MPKLPRPKLYPKVALATTTIRVPKVLELLRAHDPDVGIFVAGDLKTPSTCADFVRALGPDAFHYSPDQQKALGYACSELIGWSCIQRRNIAMLEALRWGADIIILHDDDNAPLNESYFDDFISALSHSFSGLKVENNSDGWFDTGKLLRPATPQRGIPHNYAADAYVSHAVEAKIGVAAGACLGDPDISAYTRMALAPEVHGVSLLADAGIIVDPRTKTVFNSQNTAVIRELVPAMLLVPQFKRFDDIFASLVTQRIMRERGYHVHFGRPYIWQSRNPHSLLQDLDDELWGMQHIVQFADWLDSLKFQAGASVLDAVRQTYARINELPWMFEGVTALGQAWCDDVAEVL